MDDLDSLLAEINSISSVNDVNQLEKLQHSLDALFGIPNHERAAETLFHLFERFPEGDASGLFWSVLDDLEQMPGYEQELIKSVKRKPSEFSLRMVNRLLNNGVTRVGDVDLLDLLMSVADDPTQPENIRSWARDFVE
jgi:hypothetical protein